MRFSESALPERRRKVMEPATGERYEVTVIKLGGSLITDKTRQDSLYEDVLTNIAGVLARHLAAFPQAMMIIMGGGSVGHFAAKELAVDRGVPECDLGGLHRMASKMYKLKCYFADLLEQQGVAAMPFQETSCLVAREDGSVLFQDAAVRHALRLRLVPILSGGLVFDIAHGVRALNGDLLALALDDRAFHIKRVIMLTDVAGVISADGSAIKRLDEDSKSKMARSYGSGEKVDLTGGIDTKVEVALELARRGIPTVICSGNLLDDARFACLWHGTPEDCTTAGFSG
jgi:isopentenyl phosphate kinase